MQLWQRDTRVLQWTKAWLFKQHDHYCWEISPPHASLKVYGTLVGYPSWWILHTGTRAFEDEASGAVVAPAALQHGNGQSLGTDLASGLTSMTRQSRNNLRNNACWLMAFRSIEERA